MLNVNASSVMPRSYVYHTDNEDAARAASIYVCSSTGGITAIGTPALLPADQSGTAIGGIDAALESTAPVLILSSPPLGSIGQAQLVAARKSALVAIAANITATALLAVTGRLMSSDELLWTHDVQLPGSPLMPIWSAPSAIETKSAWDDVANPGIPRYRLNTAASMLAENLLWEVAIDVIPALLMLGLGAYVIHLNAPASVMRVWCGVLVALNLCRAHLAPSLPYALWRTGFDMWVILAVTYLGTTASPSTLVLGPRTRR